MKNQYLIELEKLIGKELNETDKIEVINLGFKSQNNKIIGLSLRNQNLSIFPNQIRNMKDLEYLDLSKNQIREIPDWIDELKKLKIFILTENQISELTSSIGKMESLEVLHLLKNPIEKLPMTFRRYADIYSKFRELAIKKYGLDLNTIETINLLRNRGVRIIESRD